MKTDEVDVDGIQRRLGTGKFQILAFLALGLIYSRGAWHVFGIMFLAGDPGHKCALPAFSNDANERTESELSSPFLDIRKLEPQSSVNASHNQTDTDSGHSNAVHTAAVSTLPTTIEIDSDRVYAFHGDGLDLVKSNLTAETCGVSYVTRNGSSVRLKEECPYGWSYGSVFEKTVLSEWDLVCGRDFLVELSAMIFMVGSTVGAMLILPLADRFGRKRVMVGCLLCQACVGTATAFVGSYALFTFLRFVIGMINIGVGLSSYVLVTEIFPAHNRTVMSIAFQAFWAGGVMTLAGFGYLVRHWRHLELLLSLPNLLALPCYWLLPESLPWLISQKRWKEAQTTVSEIARINGKDAEEFRDLFVAQSDSENTSAESVTTTHRIRADENTEAASTELEAMIIFRGAHKEGSESNGHAALQGEDLTDSDAAGTGEDAAGDGTAQGANGRIHEDIAGSTKKEKKSMQTRHSICDLFRFPRMRLYSCIMFFLFFINSLGYFGISFSVPVLHGNPFVNLCIMGAVELPANVICILISHKVGRRYPNALFLLLCGISNIVALFTPSSIGILKLTFVMLGKFAITAAYSTIYLYSAEIFPTAIRNQAMGMSSVFENIGSISAPFMVLAARSIAELPLVVFGVLSIAGACLTLLLPETHNRPLPQTVQEITTW